MKKYCTYCRDEIKESDTLVYDDEENPYHKECKKQMETYYDRFDQ